MADIVFTAANIRALLPNGAIVRPYRAGGTITVGHLVYIATDGDVERADANGGTPAEQAIGVAVESFDGETTISSGDPCSVCVFGPVSGFESMTPGTVLWVSDTVGRIADAAGSYDRIIGHAETDGIVWINPEQSTAAS